MDVRPITPWFSRASRELARACLGLGLEAPSFCAPPGLPDADRTLRWRAGGGGAVVAVRLRGRDPSAIRDDMVDGILTANAVARGSADRDRLRAVLVDVVPLPEGREAA